MKNEVAMKPFPENLFADLGREAPKETPDDFIPTFMYILYSVAPPRDVKLMILRYKNGKSFDEIAKILDISRQRASAIAQEVLGRITGDHANMLSKGMSQYMEDVLCERVTTLSDHISDEEREAICSESYALGLRDGLTRSMPAINEKYNNVQIETLGFSQRAYNACSRNGMNTLADILRCGDNIANCRWFGAKSFHEICSVLEEMSINPDIYFPGTVSKYGRGEIA